MNNPFAIIRVKWVYFVLSALTGAVLATGMVVSLVSEKVGAMQLASWQIAMIYFSAIACGVLFALRTYPKRCSEETPGNIVVLGDTESKPS